MMFRRAYDIPYSTRYSICYAMPYYATLCNALLRGEIQ